PLACCPHHPRTPARCASATPTPAPTWPAATSALADRARPGSRSAAPSAVLSSPCTNPTTYPTDLWRRTLVSCGRERGLARRHGLGVLLVGARPAPPTPTTGRCRSCR